MEIVQDYKKYPIISAVIDEDIKKIGSYLKNRANINETNEDRNTALIVASFLGNVQICEYLIKKGALIDYSNKQGKNAVIIAYENHKHEIVELLTSKGANIDLETDSGTPYLYNSVSMNDSKMVKIMLEAGVSTEKVNEFGDTPLQCAVRDNNPQMAQILVDYGANIFDDKYNNFSVLMNACDVGNVNVVKWLIKHNARLEHKTVDGRTALMIAAQLGHYDVVELLVNFNANIESKDFRGTNALMKAAQNGYQEIVEFLVEKGANIDASDDDGWTALHYACLTGGIPIIKYFLDEKIDREFRIDPITVAIESFQLSTVIMLSQNGFSLTKKLADGRTYLELAEDVNCMSVSIFLRDFNAGIFDETKLEQYLEYDDNFETIESIDEDLEGFTPTSFNIKREQPNIEFDEEDSDIVADLNSIIDNYNDEDTDEPDNLNTEIETEVSARNERLKLLDELSGSFNLETEIDKDVSVNVDTEKLNAELKSDLEDLLNDIKKTKLQSTSETVEPIEQTEHKIPTIGDKLPLNRTKVAVEDDSEIEITDLDEEATFDEIDPLQSEDDEELMNIASIDQEIEKLRQETMNITSFHDEVVEEESTKIAKSDKNIDIDDLLASFDEPSSLQDDLSSLMPDESDESNVEEEVIEDKQFDTIELESKTETIDDTILQLTKKLSEIENETDDEEFDDFELDEINIEEEFSFDMQEDLDFIGYNNERKEVGRVFEEFDFTKRVGAKDTSTANLFKDDVKTETVDIRQTKIQEEPVLKEASEKETVKFNKVRKAPPETRIREDDAEFVDFEALSHDEYIPNNDEVVSEELSSLNTNYKINEQRKNLDIVEELFRLNVDLVHDGRFRPDELYDIIRLNQRYIRANPTEDRELIEIISFNEDLLVKNKINEEELFEVLDININDRARFEVVVDKLINERVNVNKPEVVEPYNSKIITDTLGEENHIPARSEVENIEERDDFISKTIVRALSLDQEYGLGKSPRRPNDSVEATKSIDGNLYDKNIDSKEVDNLIFANKKEEQIYNEYMERLKPGSIYESENSPLVDIEVKTKKEESDFYAESTSATNAYKNTTTNQNPHEAVKILNEMFNKKDSEQGENKESSDDDSYNKILEEVKEFREENETQTKTLDAEKVPKVEKIEEETTQTRKVVDSESLNSDKMKTAKDPEVTLRTLLQDFVYAINHNDTDLILGLQNIGFFISELEHIEISPLILAISNNNMVLFDYFLSSGAKVNIRVEKGFTPLMVAAQYNNPYALEVLISYGAFINDVSDRDFTALMIASQRGNLDAVTILCQYGADYYINSTCGNSALILATAKNRINVVEFFIQEGFDLLVETDEGLTALDIAYAKNFYRMIQVLSYATYSNGY